MTLAARRLLLLLAISALCSACAPPLQNGGVTVMPGSAERLEALCRWRRGAATDELCAVEESAPQPPRTPTGA